MEIFEWIRDIERVYDNLIKNAKNINLKDIEQFREEQARNFDEFITKINVLVNTAIGNLTLAVDVETNTYEKDSGDAINKIEVDFKKKIANLQKLIIEKVGLDF